QACCRSPRVRVERRRHEHAAESPAMTGGIPPTGPALDAAGYESLRAQHDAGLRHFNHLDPTSPVYGRPDKAQEYRDRAELNFKNLLARHGIVAPQPKSPEQIASETLDADWRRGLGTRQRELYDEQLKA